jgi:hypothetical protein
MTVLRAASFKAAASLADVRMQHVLLVRNTTFFYLFIFLQLLGLESQSSYFGNSLRLALWESGSESL